MLQGNNRIGTFRRDISLFRRMEGETALLDEYNSNIASSSSNCDVIGHNSLTNQKQHLQIVDENQKLTTEFNSYDVYPSCSNRYSYQMENDGGVIVQQPNTSSRAEASIIEMNDNETDMDEELTHSCKQIIVPSKTQVLFYVSTCARLRMNHQGSELQVTDAADFPLLDIWSENVCDESPVWIIESYGHRVAVVTDTSPRSFLSLFVPFMKPRRGPPSFSVIDWNGDIIGYYVLANDSIEIHDIRKEIIAKCYCEPSANGETWRIICEKNNQRQLAHLEPNGSLSFATDITLPMKILLISTLSRAIITRTRPSCFPFFR